MHATIHHRIASVRASASLPRAITVPVIALFVGACATGQGRPAAPPAPTPPVTHTSWVTRSAEYGALTRQVYAHATESVTRAAAGRERGSWAVILDADETVISNLTYQLERERLDSGFTAPSWNAWTKRREAMAIPGAKAFLDLVRNLGGRIAIVTNRLEIECPDSRANFDQLALPYDVFLCRPTGAPSDKNPRFAAVAAGAGLSAPRAIDVVAWIGDNILDFPMLDQTIGRRGDQGFVGFGVRYFMMPNPMYGSWQ